MTPERDFSVGWHYTEACSVYGELHVLGEYGVRLNTEADEDDRGGHTAWEVWHWPTNTVESDWFGPRDAYDECLRLSWARNEPGPLRRGRGSSGPGGDAVMRSADEH